MTLLAGLLLIFTVYLLPLEKVSTQTKVIVSDNTTVTRQPKSIVEQSTVVQAVWSDWTPWSACAGPCDNAIQSRLRFCYRIAASEDCDGVRIARRVCTLKDCQGTWSVWSQWSDCSATCGTASTTGHKISRRKCVTPPCTGVTLRVMDCRPAHDCPCRCPAPVPQGGWSKCTLTCGEGIRARLYSQTCSCSGQRNGTFTQYRGCLRTKPCPKFEWLPNAGKNVVKAVFKVSRALGNGTRHSTWCNERRCISTQTAVLTAPNVLITSEAGGFCARSDGPNYISLATYVPYCSSYLSRVKVVKVEPHPRRMLCRITLNETLSDRKCFRPLRCSPRQPNKKDIIQLTGWAAQNITQSPSTLKVGSLLFHSLRHPQSCKLKYGNRALKRSQFCGKHTNVEPPCGERGSAALMKNRSGKYKYLLGLSLTRSCEKQPWTLFEDVTDICSWIKGR